MSSTGSRNVSRSSGADDSGPWQPTYTRREAVKAGLIAKPHFERIMLWCRMVVGHHLAAGTPRSHWEPTSTHVEQFVGRYLALGQNDLRLRLAFNVDPRLDQMQSALNRAGESLQRAAELPGSLCTPETRLTYSGSDAVRIVEEKDRKIEADVLVGKAHHRRTGRTLMTVGRWAPWIEAVGFLAFVTYYLNVPLLSPWDDWLGWTFAVSVVAFVILGQTWLVHHAAVNHNHGREEVAEENRHEADAARTRRNWYLAAGGVVASAITSGMILRGTVALGEARIGTTAVMVFLAAVTGLLMPTLAYLAVALDGSRLSRERDGLAEGLDEDLDEHVVYRNETKQELAFAADVKAEILHKVLPETCAAAKRIVEPAYAHYNFARIQIGRLTADPPGPGRAQTAQAAGGGWSREVSTGVPGARAIDMSPLQDRVDRLSALDRQRADLQAKLDALPRHPWIKLGT